MRLNERDIRFLAAALSASEKGVSKLLGSVRISLPARTVAQTEEDVVSPRQELELGLRLQTGEAMTLLIGSHGKEEMLRRFEKALRAYYAACPLVCAWVGRGDFDPTKLPSQLNKGMIVHACRTAGRLRAEAMRS